VSSGCFGQGLIFVPVRPSQEGFIDAPPIFAPEASISQARLRHRPPDKAAGLFVRSLKLALSGAWLDGAKQLEKAVEIDPGYAEAHGNLGAYYLRLDRPADATEELRRAIGLDPRTGVYYSNLALALIQLRRFGEAEPEARTAVTLDPTNIPAQFLLGYLLAQHEETRRAAEPHLIFAGRELAAAHLLLSEIYQADGNVELALAERQSYQASGKTRPIRK
jgi:tetratricopeptide (TPR) repeat protein